MSPFLNSIANRVLVCDGAMGSLLYERGAFVNRAFEELNLTRPELVEEVHRAYVEAGADVLETNTFGANRVRLQGFGLADKVADLNRAGVNIARAVAGSGVYVAGAVGPLGLSFEASDATTHAEATRHFREQAEALSEAGVDLFMLETFRSVDELVAAVTAVLSVSDHPVVAQMTINDRGEAPDGVPPELFARRLLDAGASVVGVNCGSGAASMLETIERLQATTTAPLAAQPSAGPPREVEGRTLNMSSPDYLASYARRFARSGVRLVGGCCGTTPTHIQQIARAVLQPA